MAFVEGDFSKFRAERAKDEFASSNFGKYENLEYLGQGAMAKVYRAYDPLLRRHVALKLLHTDDPTLYQRLLNEARAQARIHHERICGVYEVGEIDGRHYIAMQYISGKSLKELSHELTVEQKLRIIQEVAEGLHAAHREGIIHRDLKPANVMLEQNADGVWVPYILDFGLARDVGHPGMTQTGAVIGSLFYMSPEQAEGRTSDLDRRTDIYSLGVTLYELLTGRLPIEGDSYGNVYLRLLEDDPAPIRRLSRNLPRDLDAITMKCLEKAPADRYDSARAFADDIQRYLNGDPILAKSRNRFSYLFRKARKHKFLVGTIVTASLLVLATVAFAILTQWKAHEEILAASEFGQDVQQIESFMRLAYMLPLHDVSGEKRAVQERTRRLKKQMEAMGSAGAGPGNYALGSSFLALHDFERARQHLQVAWDSGYQEPSVAYAFGLTLGELYQEELRQAQRLSSAALRESRIKDAEKRFRNPALSYLKYSSRGWGESTAYAQALIAFYERRYDSALLKIKESAKHSWLYEAQKLEADIYINLAYSKFGQGDFKSIDDALSKSGEIYKQVIKIARSDTSVYEGECSRLLLQTDVQRMRGNDVAASGQQGLSACGMALVADPANRTVHWKEAWLQIKQAEGETDQGHDPRKLLGLSIAEAKRDIALNANPISGWEALGYANWMLGDYQYNHGINPIQDLEESIRASKQLAHIYPNYVWSYNSIGLADWTRAQYEMSNGIDPTRFLQEAIENYQKAIRISPQYMWPYNNLGNAYDSLGLFEVQHGKDPRQNFEKAEANHLKAIGLNPSFAHGYNNLAASYHLQATYEVSQGLNSNSSIASAIRYYQKAIELKPDYVWPYCNLAQVFELQGEARLSHRDDPAEDLRQARKAIDQAFKIGSDDPLLYQTRAEVELLAARATMQQQHHSPVVFFEAAKDSLNKALELNPKAIEVLQDFTDLHRWKAQWLLSQDENAMNEIEEGVKIADRALKVDSQRTRVQALKGVLLFLAAKSHDGEISDAKALLQKSIEANENLKHEFETYLMRPVNADHNRQ